MCTNLIKYWLILEQSKAKIIYLLVGTVLFAYMQSQRGF